jgi:hypothetical protein
MISELPKTFRDAMKVCQNLSISYIWIDALCKPSCVIPPRNRTKSAPSGIFQDDKNDWKEAAATMAAKYENAYLTIAAAHSRDSNGGLFASSQSISKRLSEHPEHYVTQRLQFPESYPNVWTEETMKGWPLFTRAWAYQDRKVSSRIICFASDQVYWGCNSRLLSEDGEHNKNFTVGIKSQKNFRRRLPLASWTGNPVEDWKEMITEFSKLALTFETDRLPAIAALAQRMRNFRRNDIYVAGMWKNNILTDLCWNCIDPDSHKRP